MFGQREEMSWKDGKVAWSERDRMHFARWGLEERRAAREVAWLGVWRDKLR